MSENYEGRKILICRVCLTVINNQFRAVDEVTKESFDVLFLKVNFEISENPVICEECLEITKKSIYFKCVCVDTEKLITLFANEREIAKFEMKDMCKDNRDEDNYNNKNFSICRFCISPLDAKNFVSLDSLKKDPTFKKMLSEYMSELDFNIIENAIICSTCRNNLECYFKFTRNCHNIEEKINMFCQQDRTDGSQVNLCHVLHFLFNDISKYSESIENDEVNKPMIVKEELVIKYEGDNFNIKNNHISLETNTNKQTAHAISQLASRSHMRIHNNSKKRTLIDKDISKVKRYKCSLCSYEYKAKYWFNRHMLTHNTVPDAKMYKCSVCTFETKHRTTITLHIINHKDISDIKVYKCSLCAFKTKRKYNLKRHMVVHNDTSEIKMYKCLLCPYHCNEKYSLKRHMLVHKDVSERTIHKCSVCGLQTKYKKYLESHMLVHKGILEIHWYNCLLCSFKTKVKGNLKRHMLVHKDCSETEMYKCSSCAHQTKNKNSLKKHMLLHKDISEVKAYKCTSCTYVARQKNNLKIHMLIHEDVSKIDMFKCSLCSYMGKQKRNLDKHMLVHKKMSEAEVYKCPSCTYETKRKGRFGSHLLIHRNKSEIRE